MIYIAVSTILLIIGLILFAFILPNGRYKEFLTLWKIYRQLGNTTWIPEGCNIDKGLILGNQYGGYFTPDAKYFFRVRGKTILVYAWGDADIYINTDRWFDSSILEKFVINKITTWYDSDKHRRGDYAL